MKRKNRSQKFLTHLLSLCLVMAQLMALPARAQSSVSPVPETEGMNLASANQQAQRNAEHENRSLENGGTLSYCDKGGDGVYDQYEAQKAQYSAFTNSNAAALEDRINSLDSQGSMLSNAQNWYRDEHGAFVDPAKPIKGRYDQKKKRYDDARAAHARAQEEFNMARAEQRAAQAACSDDRGWCTPAERARIARANQRFNQASSDRIKTQRELSAAQNAYKNSPTDVANNAPSAVNDTTGNANALAGSHSVSGCGTNFDITTNTDTECALSGPLFEADTELTRIANAGVSQAKRLAADRANALFDLELQQEYSADYKLYKMAVDGGFQDQHRAAGLTNLNQIDALDNDHELKTKNLKLTISNIKTVGLASSVVKDVVCEKHDMSEADSKAAHLYKAAAATWLMAVVQDTDYYSKSSNCRVTEELAGDENNTQIITMERAANVHDQMLENLCLRVTPPDPPAPGYDWRIYGNTPEEAQMNVRVLKGYTSSNGTVYPPLKERCEEYLVNLRGEEFRDKPRTREAALEMIQEAEALALEELMAKNEKIMIAHANVKKGEQWVKQVTQRIAMMTALLAAVMAAQANAQGTCAGCGPMCGFCCSMCPVAAKLAMQAAWIGGTVLAIWLFSELMRAKAFLKKWRKKLHHAKYFQHLACNFETAQSEETRMAQLGQEAKDRKELEVEKARQNAIKGYNDKVKGLVLKENPAAQTSMLELLMDMLVGPVYADSGITGRMNGASKPTSSSGATRNQKRNIYSNANSLNVAEGTESFRYFLVQRNLQFQNHTNDITNQPEHSRDDPAIANAGAVPKNINPKVIRGIEELADYHIKGQPLNALDGLKAEEKTGFPTPETRYITIQNAKLFFQENIMLLGGGITEVAVNRDQVVDLLTETRRRLGLGTTGVGDTTLIPNSAPQPVCMVGDVSELNFDPTCGCKDDNSCSSFEYPKFNPTTPDALKTQGLLTTETANSLMSGNLSGAAVNGGRLAANSNAVRGDLLKLRNSLSGGSGTQNGKNTPSNNRDVNGDAKALAEATEGRATSSLSGMGVNNSNSPFSRARSSLLSDSNKRDAESLADQSATDESKGENKDAGKNMATGARGSHKLGSGGATTGDDEGNTSSETFSLAGDGGKLDLEGLSDEEKRRLGLLGAELAQSGEDHASNSTHIRRAGHSRGGRNGASDSSKNTGDGINKSRKSSLFRIISRRYEKTAFPLFLH